MLDLGLTKMAIIGAVALVVIGPEKLPKVARMAGTLLGRAQRYLNDVKAEVSREIELDELKKMQQGIQSAATDFHQSLHEQMNDVEQQVNHIWRDENGIQPLPEPSAISRKAREFKRRKLQRHSALPAWYKNQVGSKSQLLPASARVAKYRPKPTSKQSFF